MVRSLIQSVIGSSTESKTTATTDKSEPDFATSIADPAIPDAEKLVTPIPPAVIESARESSPLTGSDRSLIEALDGVQKLVESYEYQDRMGNAYYEVLAGQFSDPHSLRRPLRATDSELTFIVLAEGLIEIGDELEMNEREVQAIQIAHQLYAEQLGLTGEAEQVSVLTVEMSQERIGELLSLTGFESYLE